MGRAKDIGDFFDQLVKRGSGGRRQDQGNDTDQPSTPTKPPKTPAPPSSGRGRAGGTAERVRDRVRDTVSKGRDAITRRRSSGASDGASGGATTRASATTVRVEYAPVIDGDPDPGEVVWAWVPYEEDPTQGKDRPIVVIGRRGGALVGIPLTSKRHDEEAQVDVGTGGWDSQRRTSYARIWRLLEVDPGGMRREGAVLERDRFDRVIAAVGQYYDITISERPAGGRRSGGATAVDEDF